MNAVPSPSCSQRLAGRGGTPSRPAETYVNVGFVRSAHVATHADRRQAMQSSTNRRSGDATTAAKNVVVLWVTLVRLGDSTDGSSYG